MTKKKKSSEGFSWIPKVVDFFTELVHVAKVQTEDEFEKYKKKIAHYVIVYGLFATAMMFIIVGIIKYLAEIYVFETEGMAFMVVGAVLIVVLAGYTLIKNF